MHKVGTCFIAEEVREEREGRYTAVGVFAGDVTFESKDEAKLDRSVIFCMINDLAAGDYEISFRSESPEAGFLEIGSSPFVIEEDETDFISISRIKGLSFPKAGDYKIRILLNQIELTSLKLSVVFDRDGEV